MCRFNTHNFAEYNLNIFRMNAMLDFICTRFAYMRGKSNQQKAI